MCAKVVEEEEENEEELKKVRGGVRRLQPFSQTVDNSKCKDYQLYYVWKH